MATALRIHTKLADGHARTRLDTLESWWDPTRRSRLCFQWFCSSPTKSFSGLSGNSASFFRVCFVKRRTEVHYTGGHFSTLNETGLGKRPTDDVCCTSLALSLVTELKSESCPETGSPPFRPPLDQATRPHACGCPQALEEGERPHGDEPPTPPTFRPHLLLSRISDPLCS